MGSPLTSYDASVDIAWQTHDLDHPLIDKYLSFNDTIMLHADCRLGRGTHYRRYRDADGWYIRMGKRGQTKRYLTGCEITWIGASDALYQYRTKD
jgi:hypothetical protein